MPNEWGHVQMWASPEARTLAGRLAVELGVSQQEVVDDAILAYAKLRLPEIQSSAAGVRRQMAAVVLRRRGVRS